MPPSPWKTLNSRYVLRDRWMTLQIEFEFVTIPEVLALIDAGAFPQALHVGCLFLALRKRGLIPTSAP